MIQNKKIVASPSIPLATVKNFAQELGTNSLVAEVLLKRGITSVEAGKEFLYGRKEPFGNPFLIKNMARAVTRIVEAMSKGEHITVYGDYDVDGITASSLLFLFLQEQGAQVDVYIPRRDSEGYGLNRDALLALASKGTKLLITVDSGISGLEEVANGPVGMDIIITDHHMPPSELPPAYTIVNPHQEGDSYPCKELAGAGVAFKVCQALHQHLTKSQEYWSKYVELAAMGTVADLVPLQEENREIVRAGLAQLAHTQNVGLQALIKVAGVADKPLTSEVIGYVLAPRMNAAGRLDDAMDVVKMLTCGDAGTAAAIAEKLHNENIERQNISKQIYEEAETMLKAEPQQYGIVLGKEGWHPGVIGIVASRLVEKHNCPTILLSIDGKRAKGSCRSIPPVNIYETLDACAEHLEQFGGHSQAAGLSLDTENITEFRRAFQREIRNILQDEPYIPVVEPDCFIEGEQAITVNTVKKLALLEPYGRENPGPIFAFHRAEIISAGAMGKDQAHLRLSLSHGGAKYKGISWNAGALAPSFYPKERATIAFAPKLNSFQGRESVDLLITAVEPERRIVDFRNSSLPKTEILKNILQNDKKTVVYVSNISKLNKVPAHCEVLVPENQSLPADIKQLIVYDEAAIGFWQDQSDFLRCTDITLFLLYRPEDFLALRQELKRKYPDAEAMRSCYRTLKAKLAMGMCNLTDLSWVATPEGVLLTREILQVFQELGFISLEQERVQLQEAAFNPLTNSPTYSALLEKYATKIKAISKAINITSAEIAAQWK